MAVNGIGPRPAAAPPAPVDSASTTGAPGTTEASADTSSAGWTSSGSGTRKPLDLSLPPPQVSDADLEATRPNPAKQQMQAAIDTFNKKVEVALNQDALSIARGKTPVREGDQLTADQQNQLKDAATELLKNTPLGMLSPGLADNLQSALQEHGIKTRDINDGTKLGDLGSVGGDIAKSLVDNFRHNSPTAFYSLAATAAAGVGYYGYSQGSAKLASLGIKPEVKTNLFHDHLELKVGADWAAKFHDLGAHGTVTAKTNLGDHTQVSISGTANTRTGFDSARFDLNYNNQHGLSANGYLTADTHGLQDVGGNLNYTPVDNPNLTLSAGVDHNFQTDRTTGNLAAWYKLNKNVDFGLSGALDTKGESNVGVGMRIRF